MVSWTSAAEASAAGYMVQATSINGHYSSCEVMDTFCHIDNLVCGQEYSIVVEAVHDGCPGPAGPPVMLSTGECNVMVSFQKHWGCHLLSVFFFFTINYVSMLLKTSIIVQTF